MRKRAPELGGVTLIHIADPVGIVPIICTENAGAVFQAASQFNALEMTGPGVTRASRRSRALPYTPPIQRKAPNVRWRALEAPFPATISSTAAGQGGKTPQVDTRVMLVRLLAMVLAQSGRCKMATRCRQHRESVSSANGCTPTSPCLRRRRRRFALVSCETLR